MIGHNLWLVVLVWGAARCSAYQPTAAGQDLLVANNTIGASESILRFSSNGDFQGNFAMLPDRSGAVGLTVDVNGDVFIANHGSNTIRHYSSTGTDLGIFASTGLNLPTGIAFDQHGRLVVCNYGDGSLSFYSSAGQLLTRVATGLLNPIALALDRHDNIYVSTPNIGVNSGIFRFSPEGNQKSLFATGIDLDPRGLAFDQAGNLYVANQFGNSVRRYDTQGIVLDTFAHTGLKDPFALAFDANGELYVSNQAGGYIERFAITGEDLGIFAVLPSSSANPVGLAFIAVPEPDARLLLAAGFAGWAYRTRWLNWRH